MDPRVPSTQLSPEEQRPIDAFVQASPNSNYHIVEPVKGEPKVRLKLPLHNRDEGATREREKGHDVAGWG